MFEQAPIAVRDEKDYAKLNMLIDAAFGAKDVDVFLHRVTRAKLRIRDFEGILQRGLLSKDAAELYTALPVSDQGLTRERYFNALEAVPQEVRERYFLVYASY